MTVALMIFDYIDRQVIVSMFPFLKKEWGLSDKELGALVSILSITVALFGIPVAWIADRLQSREKHRRDGHHMEPRHDRLHVQHELPAALGRRAFVGLGEAGYGSVGAAMVATHFPERQAEWVAGGFFASASIGSVLGVISGRSSSRRDGAGRQASASSVSPDLILALLYLFVRDYGTVETPVPACRRRRHSPQRAIWPDPSCARARYVGFALAPLRNLSHSRHCGRGYRVTSIGLTAFLRTRPASRLRSWCFAEQLAASCWARWSTRQGHVARPVGMLWTAPPTGA